MKTYTEEFKKTIVELYENGIEFCYARELKKILEYK